MKEQSEFVEVRVTGEFADAEWIVDTDLACQTPGYIAERIVVRTNSDNQPRHYVADR